MMFGTNWRSSPYAYGVPKGLPLGIRLKCGPRVVPPVTPTMMQSTFGVGLQQLPPRPKTMANLGPRIVLPPTQTALQAGCGFGLQQLPPGPRVVTPPNVIYCYEAHGAPIVMEAEKPLLAALQHCLVDDASAEPVADGQENPGDELIDDDDAKMSQRQREEGQFGIGFWKIGISFNI